MEIDINFLESIAKSMSGGSSEDRTPKATIPLYEYVELKRLELELEKLKTQDGRIILSYHLYGGMGLSSRYLKIISNDEDLETEKDEKILELERKIKNIDYLYDSERKKLSEEKLKWKKMSFIDRIFYLFNITVEQ